ncbi:MAG: carboxypeptidase-like regulatory domain-containing protein [Cyclobacteriaceae bacterium]|nr:carboxypeptidase-like regulatory domain-containing protein [Cyclobacteriaceae bacterium]
MESRHCFWLVFIFAFVTQAAAQNITLTGTIKDKISGEALPFASIGIKGKSLGTVANLQGQFDFHIPASYANEIVVISMLGYANFEAPIWSFEKRNELLIEMNRSSILLEEITIKDSLTGGDVVRIALQKLNGNLPQEPYITDAFYRDIKKVGGRYISLLEGAVKIYDEDSKEPRNKNKLRERVKLIELRQSLGYESKFTTYFDQDNLLEDLLLNNNIRYRQIEAREKLFSVLVRQPDSYYNEHEIYVVDYTGNYHLTLYIDKTDFAIIRLDYTSGKENEILDKKKGLVSRFMGIEKTIEYKKYAGKMFVNNLRMRTLISWHDEKTNDLKFETELYQQLLINEIEIPTNERISSTESMKKYGLQYQNYTYNKKFWEDYNVIKRTPLDQQIISDLEKSGPLEKQFEEF